MSGRRLPASGFSIDAVIGLFAWLALAAAMLGQNSLQAQEPDANLLSQVKMLQPTGSAPVSEADLQFLSSKGTASDGASAMLATKAQLVGKKGGEQPPSTRGLAFPSIFRKCRNGVLLLVSPDGKSMGSGCVMDGDGHVLTNLHVVSGYKTMQAICFDTLLTTPQKVMENVKLSSCLVGDVVAVDPKRDLALLQVNSKAKLVPLRFESANDIEVTQPVFAIGHPGTFLWSYTSGSISNLINDYEWDYATGEACEADLILTQTPTNPGNSGGPLFDYDGRLIGINTFKAPEFENINLAIRLHEVQDFLEGAKAGRFLPTATQDTAHLEPSANWDAFDVDSNGTVDTYFMDSDGDGYYDVARKDENEDGKVDSYLADSNADRRFDLHVVDRNGDGHFEYWELDNNFDGTFETGGIDENGDGEPDQYFDLAKR